MAAKFLPMPPGQWDKINSQTGEDRISILKRLMKAGEALPTVDAKEIIVKNTKANQEAIARLEKEKKAQTLETNKGEITTSKIGKSPVFGGAGGGSGGGSKQTADAEIAQCVYCQFMVNNPKAKFESIQPSDLQKAFNATSVDFILN